MIKRYKIFISHRKEDTGGVAGRLFDALGVHFGRGMVFRDAEHIVEGEDISERIVEELDCAVVLLVLIGKNWLSQVEGENQLRINLKSDWVRREIEIAFLSGINVLPILVEGLDHWPEIKSQLPESIRKLCDLKYSVFFNDQFSTGLDKLVDWIQPLLPNITDDQVFLSGTDEALIGTMLDNRYELRKLLGSGGFGSVYLALDHGVTRDFFKKKVAVKVLHANLTNDEISRRRFSAGASAMEACISNEFVTSLIQSVSEDRQTGRYFFVMEYIEGAKDLMVWATEKYREWKEILEVIRQIARGLYFAFDSSRIVHRDIKPRNILVSGNPIRAKITDFDLVLNQSSRKTRAGPLGTFLFSSPEALLDGSKADQRSDVYSLAMTTVFCFYGKELPMQVVRDLDDFLINLDCPEPVMRILRKGLAQDPVDRHQSAEQFLSEIEEVVQKLSQPERVPPFIKVKIATPVQLEPGSGISLEMLALPGGEFSMGSPEGETGRGQDEKQHNAYVSSFWLASKPVTVEMWHEVMSWDTHFPSWGYGPNKLKQLPAHGLSWFDTIQFLNALSAMYGLPPCYEFKESTVIWHQGSDGFRLPTEREWEYAAGSTDNNIYPLASTLENQAWYLDNSDRRPHPVGQLSPNRWGFFDMSGNVWEWVWDYYDQYPEQSVHDYSGPDDGHSRVIRGGGNRSAAVELRCAHRDRMNPEVRDADFGFRCARGI